MSWSADSGEVTADSGTATADGGGASPPSAPTGWAGLKNIHWQSLGLDRFDNLGIGGSKIYWGQTLLFQSFFDLTGSSQGALTFARSVSAVLAASQDDFAPSGYIAGATNRLLLQAAAGGSLLNGLQAPPTDGFTVLVRNTSVTDGLTFAHLAGSSLAVNRFSCPGGNNAFLEPLANALLIYNTNVWTFA